jgi:hypothetical protein
MVTGFFILGDEVVHERYLPSYKRCEEPLDRVEVEGLLFRYKHFLGDYQIIKKLCWYPYESR